MVKGNFESHAFKVTRAEGAASSAGSPSSADNFMYLMYDLQMLGRGFKGHTLKVCAEDREPGDGARRDSLGMRNGTQFS